METIKVNTSRKSFVWNYIIGLALLLIVYISYSAGTLSITMVYFFSFLIILFFLESEAAILYTTYSVEAENVNEIRGIFSKKKTTIPFSSVAHSSMNKTVFGRILGFGDIMITPTSGPTDTMKIGGISRPERIYKIIREKTVSERKVRKR